MKYMMNRFWYRSCHTRTPLMKSATPLAPNLAILSNSSTFSTSILGSIWITNRHWRQHLFLSGIPSPSSHPNIILLRIRIRIKQISPKEPGHSKKSNDSKILITKQKVLRTNVGKHSFFAFLTRSSQNIAKTKCLPFHLIPIPDCLLVLDWIYRLWGDIPLWNQPLPCYPPRSSNLEGVKLLLVSEKGQ